MFHPREAKESGKYADEVQQRLGSMGLPPDALQRIGAFGMVWGQFETFLETAVWALREEAVTGKRPSTEGQQIGEWIKTLGKGHPKFSAEVNGILAATSQAASDLKEFRHSLFHGALLSFGTEPQAIRNPRWHGELRRRPLGQAHINSETLDAAIGTSWALCRLAFNVVNYSKTGDEKLIAPLRPKVVRAVKAAHELRHYIAIMTALMNHEKN